MTSTLNPACPLCGLRYENRPLLELHVREDHRQQAGRRGASGTEASPALAGRPSRGYDLASGSSLITKEVTAMTATCHPRSGQPMAAARRALRALRDFHDELVRASEAMLRPQGAPRPQVQAPRSGYLHPDHGTERADRAA